ncbi:hypothetical protein [Paenirhodobacter enshiensis]|uniref:hypothetical protein n=1 Tax=Paenirhodobacter enshiensis TaxID=1105367 RepID=UPI0035ADB47D
MSETITACENVCRDFSWVAPLLSMLADLGTFLAGVAACIALFWFNKWRLQQLILKQSDRAERLLSAGSDYASMLMMARYAALSESSVMLREDPSIRAFRLANTCFLAALKNDDEKVRVAADKFEDIRCRMMTLVSQLEDLVRQGDQAPRGFEAAVRKELRNPIDNKLDADVASAWGALSDALKDRIRLYPQEQNK